MKIAVTVFIILAVLVLLLFLGCLLSLYFIFFSPPEADRENTKPDKLLGGDNLGKVIKECDETTERIKKEYAHETVSVKTDDGLTLFGDFYINKNKTKNTLLCVHGYNSAGYYEFATMVEPILNAGFNCFLVNNRMAYPSEGKHTGFGVLEKDDLKKWVQSVNSYFADGKIVLYGVSMGAATVMQASDSELENVVGIIADCGFTTCYEEFKFVLKTVAHLPAFPILNVLNLLCKIILGFSLKQSDSRKALARTTLPVLFVHGDADVFVPEYMSHECYDACAGEKEIIIYEGAAHAQSHFTHREKYEKDLMNFCRKCFFGAIENQTQKV